MYMRRNCYQLKNKYIKTQRKHILDIPIDAEFVRHR